MSVASVSEEQSLQRVQQQNQNGTSDGNRLGGSPTSSNAQVSSPTKGGVDLSFGPGNEILNNQPSSPPHNYRHSRAYRHFKNPPQPHMCIRVTTLAGEEVFINVLSWTRIVVPQEPTDPIPLYGGMKVPPGSPRCPPLVYAVMANPEVLKDSGRHSKDPEERRAMVELMCDFVEAMNPDLRLNRNAVILKDRDISGELKDVWNAVQAQRDREREEQMIQQHTHVPPPQQLFPPQKIDAVQQQQLLQQQQMSDVKNSSQNNFNSSDNKVTYMELGPESAYVQGNSSRASVNSSELQNSVDKGNPSSSVAQSAIISNNSNNVKNSVNEVRDKNDVNGVNEIKNGSDQTDSPKIVKNGAKDSQTNNSTSNLSNRNSKSRSNTSPVNESPNLATSSTNSEGSSSASTADTSQNATSPVSPTASSSSSSIPSATNTASISSTVSTTATTTTTKKEKLGGFLPNSCIFPRFKNKNKDKNKEKEKDKDKDKDKEKNSSNHSSKEKTLLNSFKKTTTAATNAFTKSHNHNEDSTTATAMKNCLNLEAEVEKLDLNKMDAPHANEVLIKVATPAAK